MFLPNLQLDANGMRVGLTYTQMNSNLTSQAAEMETHGVPNDVLSNLDPFALIILIPICDFFLYPALRRVIRLTAIKKIAAGFFTGCMAMIWAAGMSSALPSCVHSLMHEIQ